MRAIAVAITIAIGWMAPAGAATIAAAVADPGRPAADIAADSVRKPAETLAFAGVKPGMVIGEFYSGGGYFTRLLSTVAGAAGQVFTIENARWTKATNGDAARAALGNPGNVSIIIRPFGTVEFSRPLDLAWLTQNYHDLKIAEYGKVDTAAFNRAVFAALKPGGSYVILDHQAPAGTDAAAIARLHRIEKAQVIREVEAAGFRLADEGMFLHRSDDDARLSIFDKKVQGRTDQYALRFVKPAF